MRSNGVDGVDGGIPVSDPAINPAAGRKLASPKQDRGMALRINQIKPLDRARQVWVSAGLSAPVSFEILSHARAFAEKLTNPHYSRCPWNLKTLTSIDLHLNHDKPDKNMRDEDGLPTGHDDNNDQSRNVSACNSYEQRDRLPEYESLDRVPELAHKSRTRARVVRWLETSDSISPYVLLMLNIIIFCLSLVAYTGKIAKTAKNPGLNPKITIHWTRSRRVIQIFEITLASTDMVIHFTRSSLNPYHSAEPEKRNTPRFWFRLLLDRLWPIVSLGLWIALVAIQAAWVPLRNPGKLPECEEGAGNQCKSLNSAWVMASLYWYVTN